VRFGIVGKRSWIAKALKQFLLKLDAYEPPTVYDVEKSAFEDDVDLSPFDCVFMIAGRARPTSQERMDEIMLMSKLPTLTKPPKRMVYFSSLAVEREPTPYSQMKMACEALMLSVPWGTVLRPPVIFGPGQDWKADMLIPQLARALAGKEHLVIREPFKSFYLMHVSDVCCGAWHLANHMLHNDAKVLRLLSDPLTPVEIITSACPGTAFFAPSGWSAPSDPEYRERSGEDWRRWNPGIPRIKETVDQMVKEISASGI
jgi:nucleoside-diphosphate-sugar epimerase